MDGDEIRDPMIGEEEETDTPVDLGDDDETMDDDGDDEAMEDSLDDEDGEKEPAGDFE